MMHRHELGSSAPVLSDSLCLQHGPSVAEMMVTLGAEEVCGRIHRALSS